LKLLRHKRLPGTPKGTVEFACRGQGAVAQHLSMVQPVRHSFGVWDGHRRHLTDNWITLTLLCLGDGKRNEASPRPFSTAAEREALTSGEKKKN
jgi:hypothetical protein